MGWHEEQHVDAQAAFAEAYAAGYEAGLRARLFADGLDGIDAEAYCASQILARTFRMGVIDGRRARYQALPKSA